MNKKIQKILACIDFSEYSLMVLEYAVELAKDANTPILVYNVINQSNYYTMATVNMAPQVQDFTEPEIEKLKKERLGWIEDLVNKHSLGEKANLIFKSDLGIPSEQILETIETEEIDLVVMANKGRGNVSRFLFGSCAEKVFRHSPVPVVSVRDREKINREK